MYYTHKLDRPDSGGEKYRRLLIDTPNQLGDYEPIATTIFIFSLPLPFFLSV